MMFGGVKRRRSCVQNDRAPRRRLAIAPLRRPPPFRSAQDAWWRPVRRIAAAGNDMGKELGVELAPGRVRAAKPIRNAVAGALRRETLPRAARLATRFDDPE